MLRAIVAFFKREEPIPLGRWCLMSSNPKCDPDLKSTLANYDNGFETMRRSVVNVEQLERDPVTAFLED